MFTFSALFSMLKIMLMQMESDIMRHPVLDQVKDVPPILTMFCWVLNG